MRSYLALSLALIVGAAQAQHKCTAPDGAVSFQQMPCPGAARSVPLVLPPPAPPAAERPERIRRAIALGRVAIGMTWPELERSLGTRPDHINKTVRPGSVDYQLVYYRDDRSRLYVYVSDGIVSSFQDDR